MNMINLPWRRVALVAMAFAFPSHLGISQTEVADLKVPTVPPNLQVPEGNSLYLKTNATGTQNYVCLPGASGPVWKFQAPQATLFVPFPWIQGQLKLQVATHFLSSNPSEAGLARPTWQSSLDTSRVWGKAIADSTDPMFVAPGAIPWLLVEAVGVQRGPGGGSTLAQTTFIHRVNTSGGIAPADGCDAAVYGKLVLVAYTADYYFYQANRRK